MSARPHLVAVETPPASPEAVARLMAAAKTAGRALSLDLAERSKVLALEAMGIAALGEAVPAGVHEQAARIAQHLTAFAANVETLSQ